MHALVLSESQKAEPLTLSLHFIQQNFQESTTAITVFCMATVWDFVFPSMSVLERITYITVHTYIFFLPRDPFLILQNCISSFCCRKDAFV
jgi:hypothetical protein